MFVDSLFWPARAGLLAAGLAWRCEGRRHRQQSLLLLKGHVPHAELVLTTGQRSGRVAVVTMSPIEPMELFREFVDVVFDGKQSKAADALGVDRSLVNRLYHGSRGTVSPDLAARIERASEGRYAKERFVWPDEPTKPEAA